MLKSTNQPPVPKKGRIEKLTFGGEGLLRDEGRVTFIPYVAPGEEVEYAVTKEKRDHAFGKLLKVLSENPERIAPTCPYFTHCQGCQLQHLSYTEQLRVKKGFITEAFERIAKKSLPDFSLVPSPEPFNYRSNIRLNLDKSGEGFKAGYIAKGELLEIESCPIFSTTFSLNSLSPFLKSLSSAGIESASLRIFKLNERYLLAFSFAPYLPQNRHSALDLLPESVMSVWMQAPGKREVFGAQNLSICFEDVEYPITPYLFSQNYALMAQELYQATLSYVPSTPHIILDLYCGVGILSDALARRGHTVVGIESNREAIHLAEERSRGTFYAGLVEEVLPALISRRNFETLLVNPPRDGLSREVLDLLLLMKPERILYTSCLPSTLARDASRLEGYSIASLKAFDLFPQTTHLETLMVFELD